MVFLPITRHVRATGLGLGVAIIGAVLASPAKSDVFDTIIAGGNPDQALVFDTPGVFDFDPVVLGLDIDGDGVFRFSTITIATGVTLRMTTHILPGPVIWLATGHVQIDGDIVLDGEPGQSGHDLTNTGERLSAVPGPGGFSGGFGGGDSSPETPGGGPGGGLTNFGGGSGAGHLNQGGGAPNCGSFGNSSCGNGGLSYGSSFLVPHIGGSGGGGGTFTSSTKIGGGGGAGGGSILIASADTININGSISAIGGRGGDGSWAGGGGSGGSIRLLARSVSGDSGAALQTDGGGRGIGDPKGTFQNPGSGGAGSPGRVRIEAFTRDFQGSSTPTIVEAAPYALFLPDEPPPRLRVTEVGGIPVVNPAASFMPADVEFDTGIAVSVLVEAQNIPLSSGDPAAGTFVTIHVLSENSPDQVITSAAPLTGTDQLSTTSIEVTFPSGFSRAFVRATWGPTPE